MRLSQNQICCPSVTTHAVPRSLQLTLLMLLAMLIVQAPCHAGPCGLCPLRSRLVFLICLNEIHCGVWSTSSGHDNSRYSIWAGSNAHVASQATSFRAGVSATPLLPSAIGLVLCQRPVAMQGCSYLTGLPVFVTLAGQDNLTYWEVRIV